MGNVSRNKLSKELLSLIDATKGFYFFKQLLQREVTYKDFTSFYPADLIVDIPSRVFEECRQFDENMKTLFNSLGD